MSLFKKDKSDSDDSGAPTGQPDMTQMVRMLAAAPEEQRSAMLGDRMAVFAEQEESMRRTTMKAMLVAALELSSEEYQKIAHSRFKALSTFDDETRVILMQSHAAVVKELPAEMGDKEKAAMTQIVSALPGDKRTQMMAMMQKLGLMGESA